MKETHRSGAKSKANAHTKNRLTNNTHNESYEQNRMWHEKEIEKRTKITNNHNDIALRVQLKENLEFKFSLSQCVFHSYKSHLIHMAVAAVAVVAITLYMHTVARSFVGYT